MYDQGYRSVKPTVKCATIVGHVMGHYHPHGDSSIYDALVHLSQSWKMEAPLVTFQGNNGSIDDDPAAANRYTEAKLSELSDYLCLFSVAYSPLSYDHLHSFSMLPMPDLMIFHQLPLDLLEPI